MHGIVYMLLYILERNIFKECCNTTSMAKNSVRMPTSHAGITSFSEDAVSKVHIKPQLVLILIGIVIVLVAALHFYGAQML